MNHRRFPKTSLRVVIACRSLASELDYLAKEDDSVVLRYLDSDFHERPQELPEKIQTEINDVADMAQTIVLGYGLCSKAVVGVVAPQQGLIMPRVHDCIALFLGSSSAYQKQFKRHPGTYYLTPGWVSEGNDPIGFMEKKYAPKMGRQKAEWGIRKELENYTHIAYINTHIGYDSSYRKRAQENARFLEKTFLELEGSSAFFRMILFGPYDNRNFLNFGSGEKIDTEFFLDNPGCQNESKSP